MSNLPCEQSRLTSALAILFSFSIALSASYFLPNTAKAESGKRVCHITFDSVSHFFERDRSDDCDDFVTIDGVAGENLATIEKEGELVDMTICENFSKWVVWQGDHENNLCAYMPSADPSMVCAPTNPVSGNPQCYDTTIDYVRYYKIEDLRAMPTF